MRPAHLAATLDVAGRDVLVIGGGVVGARRAATLVEAGARVRVVSPTLVTALRACLEAGTITWDARGYREGDCAGAFLVVVATDDAAVNARAAAAAGAAGALLNDASAPRRGDVHLPAVIRRGRIMVSVSTGGASPACSAFVRRLLEERLGDELGRLADLAARMRERGAAAGIGAADRERIAAAALPRLLALLEAGQATEAERLADELSTGPVPVSPVAAVAGGPASRPVPRDPTPPARLPGGMAAGAPEASSWS